MAVAAPVDGWIEKRAVASILQPLSAIQPGASALVDSTTTCVASAGMGRAGTAGPYLRFLIPPGVTLTPLVLLFALQACTREPDHARYARALHALADEPPGLADERPGLADERPGLADERPGASAEGGRDGRAGWSICLTVADTALRGDCQASVAAQAGWFERCGQIESKKWKDECWFEAAEFRSRGGDTTGALAACTLGGYAMQCQDHVLGMAAMAWLDLPVADVGVKFAALKVNTPGTALGFLFWRHFFRNRIAHGKPTTRVGCQHRDCRGAAETEVAAALSRAVASSRATCEALPAFAWDLDADGHRMAERAWTNACAEHPVGRYKGL